MAHSILVFQGRHVRLHDVDLSAVLCLLVDCARESQDLDAVLMSHVVSWGRKYWPSGCIDLDLEALLFKPHLVQDFLSLLERSKESAEQHGEYLNAEYLNERLGLEGLAARPSMPMKDILDTFSSLAELFV